MGGGSYQCRECGLLVLEGHDCRFARQGHHDLDHTWYRFKARFDNDRTSRAVHARHQKGDGLLSRVSGWRRQQGGTEQRGGKGFGHLDLFLGGYRKNGTRKSSASTATISKPATTKPTVTIRLGSGRAHISPSTHTAFLNRCRRQ